MSASPSVFEASGKLVLLGEYAVVDGGAALVLAVAHGVRCTVTPSAERVIETPTGDDRYVQAALDAVDAPAARYVFTDRNPLDTAGKPGMGGSAAATVAALRAGGFSGSDRALVQRGIEVHRAVQGGGSGVDIAAAALGGGVRFQRGRATTVDLPKPVVIYSGRSAHSGPRVRLYEAWSGRQSFVTASDVLVREFMSGRPLTAVRSAWRLLCGMAEQAGLAYRTPAIDRIVALAEQHGGAAKPSGAGGGDSVVAFLPEPRPFVEAVRAEGFEVLRVKPDPSRG